MTITVSTASIGKPSAFFQRTLTDAERLAFGTGEIAMCIDASERATGYGGYHLRDRAAGRVAKVIGGTETTLNDNPAVEFQNSGGILVPYQVGASYFMAVAVDVDSHSDTVGFVTNENTTGARLFFGLLSDGNLRLDHGTSKAISVNPVPASTGTHIFWGSFDAETNTAEIGMDAVTALASDTTSITAPHKGAASIYVFGGTGTNGVDGKGQIAVFGEDYLGGTGNEAKRTFILRWLAERSGVTLGA
jgi:hypothetical protein